MLVAELELDEGLLEAVELGQMSGLGAAERMQILARREPELVDQRGEPPAQVRLRKHQAGPGREQVRRFRVQPGEPAAHPLVDRLRRPVGHGQHRTAFGR